MKIAPFLFVFFICTISIAQERYLDLEEALKNPKTVEYLYLDCNTDDCNKIFSNLNQYTNLKGLYLSGYSGKSLEKYINSLNKLESLTIENSPQLNYSKIFSGLKKNQLLTNLSLKNNNLTKLPGNITLISSLKSINISNNEKLNLEKTINQLASLKNLEELYLPVNSITDLPDNIKTLRSLKTLDISNNYLEDLPNGISELRKLDELFIEGNIISDPVSSLKKSQNISLKYISLDEGLSDDELKRLHELFPEAKINEVDNTASLDEQIDNSIEDQDTLYNRNNDTNIVSIDNGKNETNEKESNEITFGELNIENKDLKIYSQAYIHYPDVFKLRRFSVFDSTMFEERFLDTTYANVTKIQYYNTNPRVYEKFCLVKNRNHEKNDTWFNFRSPDFSYLTRNNPELNAFIGMSWAYVGKLSSKEFKKKFLLAKDYKWYKIGKWLFYWNKWRKWTDVRITYNNEAQNFTIKMKDLDGFTEFTAYPRYNSLSRSIEDAQKTYVKRYARYSRTLDTRKKRFEKHHQRDKAQFEKSNLMAEKKRWLSFQKNYMSEEERKLTKEEWLNYYDKVIANEKKAMGNASANINNIERSIKLDGYSSNYLWVSSNRSLPESSASVPIKDSVLVGSIKSLFQNKDSNMVAVKRILIINKDNKTYQVYEGSLGINIIRLNLVQGSNVDIIAQLRNDDIGYVKSGTFKKIEFPKNKKYKFTLNTVNAKIATVQMLRMELGF